MRQNNRRPQNNKGGANRYEETTDFPHDYSGVVESLLFARSLRPNRRRPFGPAAAEAGPEIGAEEQAPQFDDRGVYYSIRANLLRLRKFQSLARCDCDQTRRACKTHSRRQRPRDYQPVSRPPLSPRSP